MFRRPGPTDDCFEVDIEEFKRRTRALKPETLGRFVDILMTMFVQDEKGILPRDERRLCLRLGLDEIRRAEFLQDIDQHLADLEEVGLLQLKEAEIIHKPMYEHYKKRRAPNSKKKTNNPRAISPRTRFKVLETSSFRCAYCGATSEEARLEIDHIHPVSKGGDGGEGNLVAACKKCNAGKNASVLVAFPASIAGDR